MATKTARGLARMLRSYAQTTRPEVTDKELLRRFAGGDEAAFTALLRLQRLVRLGDSPPADY
jgi:hypothetical protein